MDTTIVLVILGTLASKFTDFLKFLRAKDWNAAITQLVVWVVGAVVMFLASAAEVAHDIVIPTLNVTFGGLDAWSKILIGTSVVSLLSTVYDFKKAIDGSDSAHTPPLVE